MAITKVIESIPEAPSRADPENFDARADAFLKRLETLDEDLNEWANECNQTQAEINTAHDEALQARDDALTYKEDAYKWAQEAEDVQVSDGTHTGYSAYHWARKTQKIKEDVEEISINLGYKGEWSDTTTYSMGDVVLYSGSFYLSLINDNLNNPPDSSPTAWKQTITSQSVYAALMPYLTTVPVPFAIPLLDENGYITPYIALKSKLGNISNLTFSANTVYQAKYDALLYITIGGSNVTFTFGLDNPPSSAITLKANNTVALFITKDMYVQFTADTNATILSEEVENVFV